MSQVNFKALDNEQLADLAAAVNGEVERRRQKVTLDQIKPGMSGEDLAAVRAEIARALRETGR